MRVTNLTNAVQKLTVTSLVGERESFDIFIQPKGFTDLSWKLAVDAEQYKDIFEFEGEAIPVTKTASAKKAEKKVEEITPELVGITEDESEEAPEDEAPKSDYVCDICGAEFGSEKGLKAHKRKAHS